MRNIEYRGFISFSHKDESVSVSLHKRLEAFRVPKSLHGHNLGSARLGTFFRDREELAANSQLSEHLRDALARSRSLIVICSLNSVNSSWVKLEIETYLKLRPGGDIFAVIAEGEPPDCFPLPLRSIDLVAADFRSHADGEENGSFKLIAGMLGISFGDLRDRVAVDERLRKRRTNTVAASLGLLSFISLAGLGSAVYYARRANELAVEAIEVSGSISDQAYTMGLNYGATLDSVEEILKFSKTRLESLRHFSLQDDEITARSSWVTVRFAQLELQREQFDRALEQSEQAISKVEGKKDYGAISSYCGALMAKAAALLGLKRNSEALAVASQAVTATDTVNLSFPDDYKTRLMQSEALGVLGEAQEASQLNEEGIKSFASAVRILRELLKEFPNSATFPMRISEYLEKMGDIAINTNDSIRASAWYVEAAELQERFLQYNKPRISAIQGTQDVALKAAETSLKQGKNVDAARMIGIAIRAMTIAKEKYPDNPRIEHNLKRSRWALSEINQGRNPFERNTAKINNPGVERDRNWLTRANRYINRGLAFADKGQAGISLQEYIKAADMLRGIISKGDGELKVQEKFVAATMLGGATAVDVGKYKIARDLLIESINTLKDLARRYPDVPRYSKLITTAETALSTVP